MFCFVCGGIGLDDFSIGDRLREVEEESDLVILVGREESVSAPGRCPRFFFILDLSWGTQIPAGVGIAGL